MDYEAAFDRRVNKTEFERRISKIYTDLYEGQGRDNPLRSGRSPRTILEVAMDKLNSNLSKLVWLMVGGLIAGLVNIAFHLAGK